MKKDKAYLQDILDAISDIGNFIDTDNLPEFKKQICKILREL